MVCVAAAIPQSMRGAAFGRSARQQGAAAYIAAVQWPTGIIAGATSTVRLYSADTSDLYLATGGQRSSARVGREARSARISASGHTRLVLL